MQAKVDDFFSSFGGKIDCILLRTVPILQFILGETVLRPKLPHFLLNVASVGVVVLVKSGFHS